MNRPHVVFDNVSHTYGDSVVLQHISLNLTEPRIGIIGANGSGKSTLIRMINGLVTPTEGSVTACGLNVADHGKAVRQKVGFIFPDPDTQIVMPTVGEDIGFSLRRHKLSKAALRQRIEQIAQHHNLGEFVDHPAHLLSSGQKQMLAFASIRATEPEVLVCDEPTTLLDLRNTTAVMHMLEHIPEQVIVATHDLDLLAGWARVICLHDGRVAADGPAAETIATYRRLIQC